MFSGHHICRRCRHLQHLPAPPKVQDLVVVMRTHRIKYETHFDQRHSKRRDSRRPL